MQSASTTISRTRFSTPTVEDLTDKLRHATKFTKKNSAFQQLELDESSRYITVFQAVNRIKCLKRLLFGVNRASDELQHVLSSMLADIENCINIADDHCVKSVRIQSYSGPHFPALGLNTERYSVSLHIQCKCRKIRTRITPNIDIF